MARTAVINPGYDFHVPMTSERVQTSFNVSNPERLTNATAARKWVQFAAKASFKTSPNRPDSEG